MLVPAPATTIATSDRQVPFASRRPLMYTSLPLSRVAKRDSGFSVRRPGELKPLLIACLVHPWVGRNVLKFDVF